MRWRLRVQEMLATVDEFRRMVPGAASRMTDEQIEDLIRNIERWCRGIERQCRQKRQPRKEAVTA